MLRLFLIFTCNLNCVADVHFKILLSLCKAWSFVMKMFEALMAFELPIKRYFIFNSKISNNRLNRNNDCYRNIQLVDECFESTRALTTIFRWLISCITQWQFIKVVFYCTVYRKSYSYRIVLVIGQDGVGKSSSELGEILIKEFCCWNVFQKECKNIKKLLLRSKWLVKW